MNRVCSIFSQILQFFPRLEFEASVQKHQASRLFRVGDSRGGWEGYTTYNVDHGSAVPARRDFSTRRPDSADYRSEKTLAAVSE